MHSQLSKIIFAVCTLTLLQSCAPIQKNYFTQTTSSWRGSHLSTLLKTWGKPDKKIATLSGSTMYVYKKQDYLANNEPNTPQVGVSYHPGSAPILVTDKQKWNTHLTLFCIVAFEVDTAGQIIDVQSQGNNCYANAAFLHRMGSTV